MFFPTKHYGLFGTDACNIDIVPETHIRGGLNDDETPSVPTIGELVRIQILKRGYVDEIFA